MGGKRDETICAITFEDMSWYGHAKSREQFFSVVGGNYNKDFKRVTKSDFTLSLLYGSGISTCNRPALICQQYCGVKRQSQILNIFLVDWTSGL